MKKAAKHFATKAAVCLSLFVIIIMLLIIMLSSLSGDSKSALAASANKPERVSELMLIKYMGVPHDIVMMITTAQCKNDKEALEKPFIYNALEFLRMEEVVKELHHTCDKYNDDGQVVDEDAECNDDYVFARSITYEFRTGIVGYIGNAHELNAANLFQIAQAAADACSAETSVDDIRLISFVPIGIEEYIEAIKRCGIKKPMDIDGIIEMHTVGYFSEWLDNAAHQQGIDPGKSTVSSGSTHNAIRQVLTRPDNNIGFFGGSAILPVQSGNYVITSEYGPRDFAPDPFHTGLDFADPMGVAGTPIMSVMDGIVLLRLTSMNSYGHHIVIYHGGKITTMYAHMTSFGSYNVGDRVSAGDIIGYMGTTGLSTGVHLHLEYQIDGSPVNPRAILPPT